jgi:predicted ATPase
LHAGKGDQPDGDPFYYAQFLPNDGASERGWRRYQEISFGTRRILRIFASILIDRSSVMLIEQPEDGIHPGLLHKLMPLLEAYSEDAQFVFSSHSTAIFNRLAPDQIRLVDMQNGKTEIRSLSEEEVTSAERFISEDGPLSDFLESIQT